MVRIDAAPYWRAPQLHPPRSPDAHWLCSTVAHSFFRRHGLGPTVLAYLEAPLEKLQIQGSRATAKIGDFGTMSFEKTGAVWLVDHPRERIEALERGQGRNF